MNQIEVQQSKARDKSRMSMMEAASKAKRYNDLVEDLQQKNIDKLIDNCDPNHL